MNKSNNTKSKEFQKTLRIEKEKERKEIMNKQSKIASLISNIGKLIILVRNTRKSLSIKDFTNLNTKQFDLINDLAYPKDEFKSIKKKELLLEYVRETSLHISFYT